MDLAPSRRYDSHAVTRRGEWYRFQEIGTGSPVWRTVFSLDCLGYAFRILQGLAVLLVPGLCGSLQFKPMMFLVLLGLR